MEEKSKENNPPVSEVSRDVANLIERKKMPKYMVSVCLSACLPVTNYTTHYYVKRTFHGR